MGALLFQTKLITKKFLGPRDGVGKQYGVPKLFPLCSTKLETCWLRGQRKLSLTGLHFHILSQHSVVVQWEMPLGAPSPWDGAGK